ncbi:unnamed protein product, partial [Mesorhabditis spiculigera]
MPKKVVYHYAFLQIFSLLVSTMFLLCDMGRFRNGSISIFFLNVLSEFAVANVLAISVYFSLQPNLSWLLLLYFHLVLSFGCLNSFVISTINQSKSCIIEWIALLPDTEKVPGLERSCLMETAAFSTWILHIGLYNNMEAAVEDSEHVTTPGSSINVLAIEEAHRLDEERVVASRDGAQDDLEFPSMRTASPFYPALPRAEINQSDHRPSNCVKPSGQVHMASLVMPINKTHSMNDSELRQWRAGIAGFNSNKVLGGQRRAPEEGNQKLQQLTHSEVKNTWII